MVSLEDVQEVDGVNGMESRAALFDICEKSGGNYIGINVVGLCSSWTHTSSTTERVKAEMPRTPAS